LSTEPVRGLSGQSGAFVGRQPAGCNMYLETVSQEKNPKEVWQEHLKGVYESAKMMSNNALGRQRTPDRALKLMAKLHAITETNIGIVSARLQALPQAQREMMTPQCSAGCDYCCVQLVRVTACEVLAVYAFVKANFSEEAQEDLLKRLVETKEYTLSKPATTSFRHQCPMLVDHKCSVYFSRPFICRGINSASVAACKAGYAADSTGPAAIPIVDSMRDVAVSVRWGLKESMVEQGLEGPDLYLHLAMLTLMQDASAVDKFFVGEPVFQSAVIPANE